MDGHESDLRGNIFARPNALVWRNRVGARRKRDAIDKHRRAGFRWQEWEAAPESAPVGVHRAEPRRGHQSFVEYGADHGQDGSATISLDPAEVRWIQVWADGRVLCQPDANQASFSVTTITTKGVATLNNCSAVVHEASPGQFILFARPKTFSEKMHE
jgi:hypothetical protein